MRHKEQKLPIYYKIYSATIKWVLLEGWEIYCGGGFHGRKMIFWGQYIVSPRAQTTQTIPGGGSSRNVFLLPHFEAGPESGI